MIAYARCAIVSWIPDLKNTPATLAPTDRSVEIVATALCKQRAHT